MGAKAPRPAPALSLSEDADYYFDAEAGERPIRFVERYCQHYEGRFAGQPFLLHDVQKRIIRDVYGWKSRATGLRRFTDVYFEAAVGAGKSPLLAALGLYGLIGDGERGAQVYSLASNYGQARVVFDAAKRFVNASNALSTRLNVVDREIRHPASSSVWRIVSGKGPGAGCRPSMILADEVHEWPNAGGYKALRDRMSKRQQPLLFAATNAGASRASFCWQLREKAVAALAGKGEPTLYPIIWAAPETARTDDPAAWRVANPLIGVTIAEQSVRQMCSDAMADPTEEAGFRRLYLGVWPKAGGGRWLNLSLWDACESVTKPPADAPKYVGVDLSQSDDLCSAVTVHVTPELYHVRAHFWMPRATAEHYRQHDEIPYDEWAAAGFVTLLDEPTVSAAARKLIAAAVIADAGKTLKAVCYDTYGADGRVS